MRLFLLLLWCFLVRIQALAQQPSPVILVDSEDKTWLIGQFVEVLEDKTNRLTPEDILQPAYQNAFKRNDKEIFNRPAAQTTYWLRIRIRNQTATPIWMVFDNTFIWRMKYFTTSPTGRLELQAEVGSLLYDKNKLYPSNVYWLPVTYQKDSLVTVYVRIDAEASVIAPIILGTLQNLHVIKTYNDYTFGGFVGLVILMLGYNFFLYFVTRDKIYLTYCAYLFCALFVVPYLCNYQLLTYLFPDSWKPLLNEYFMLWQNLVFVAIVVFAIQFLNLRERLPRFSRYLQVNMLVLAVVLPALQLLGLLNFSLIFNLFQLFVLLLYFSLLGVGLYLWVWKKDTTAFLYTVAWFWVISFTFVYLFYVNGLLPYHYITRNATFFGISLEILFFSLALGYKINQMRADKEQAQAENLRLVSEQNKILEEKVTERTLALQEANEEIKQNNEEIKAALTIVAEQRDDILSSINYAKRIQEAILPRKEIITSLFADSMVLYMPKDIVSGDFYWFAQTEQYIFLAAADCTGHGVPGAFMTVVGENLLRQIITQEDVVSPAKILDKLDQRLLETLNQKDEGQTSARVNDGMDISLMRFDLSLRQLTWASAKRPLWIYTPTPDQNLPPIMLKGDKYPIGSNQYGVKKFTEQQIKLQPGDRVYTFSDGYADQFGPQGKFTVGRFRQLLTQMHQLPMQTQAQKLQTAFAEWKQNDKQTDDVLIIGLAIS